MKAAVIFNGKMVPIDYSSKVCSDNNRTGIIEGYNKKGIVFNVNNEMQLNLKYEDINSINLV